MSCDDRPWPTRWNRKDLAVAAVVAALVGSILYLALG